jgi:hypothetical protein
MKIQNVISTLLFLVAFVFIAGSPANVQAKDAPDAFAGTVEKIDAEAKMIYVKSKDGVVKAFKWTKTTTTHGIKAASVWTDHAAHVGAHVVVRAVTIAGEETIKGLHWFGTGALKVTEATVHYVAGEARKMYDVSEHAVVDTGKAIGHGAKEIGKQTGKEFTAVIHTIESDGKEFIHFIEHKKKP